MPFLVSLGGHALRRVRWRGPKGTVLATAVSVCNASLVSCSAFARRAAARSGLLLLVALIAAPLAARSADAAQQQNAYAYAYWRWTPQTPTTIVNVDQELNILEAGRSTYWSMPFNTSGGGAGYMGLQSNAPSFQGTSGKIALFSWTGATDSDGPHCQAFAPEPGALSHGVSCHINYRWHNKRWYRLRVWRLNRDDAGGWWWGAWVLDEKTGTDTLIGRLLAPADQDSITDSLNFIEYFGNAVKAPSKVPQSAGLYTQPAANSHGHATGLYDAVSQHTSFNIGNGATSSTSMTPVVTPQGPTNAARLALGGKR